LLNELTICFITLSMRKEKIKPKFERRIFWDVDFDAIDYDKSARFVIERVFERGDVEDYRQCFKYYSEELITSVILNARFLPEHRMFLAAAVINKPVNELQCYTLRQLNPGLFPY
jgi:hypothetical protein